MRLKVRVISQTAERECHILAEKYVTRLVSSYSIQLSIWEPKYLESISGPDNSFLRFIEKHPTIISGDGLSRGFKYNGFPPLWTPLAKLIGLTVSCLLGLRITLGPTALAHDKHQLMAFQIKLVIDEPWANFLSISWRTTWGWDLPSRHTVALASRPLPSSIQISGGFPRLTHSLVAVYVCV